MKEGRLSYNQDEDRYGLLVGDLWYHPGLHCGETLEVMLHGAWTPTRMEMDTSGLWYLVGTPLVGIAMEDAKARL